MMHHRQLWKSLSRVSLFGWRNEEMIQSYVQLYKKNESVFHSETLSKEKHTNKDYSESLVAANATKPLFLAAADKLWQFQYFTPDTMSIYSTFQAENRAMQKGDLICERIHIVPGFLETMVFNTVVNIIDEPQKKGFVVDSTEIHDEIGRLSCCVEFRDNKDLFLTVDATCMFLVAPFRKLARYMQVQAHNKAITEFRDSLLSQPLPKPYSSTEKAVNNRG